MKADYVPALQPRGVSTLRCGHRDCRYYGWKSDSCDYLLREYRPRGCPPTPDCAQYAPRSEEDLKNCGLALDFFRLCGKITPYESQNTGGNSP